MSGAGRNWPLRPHVHRRLAMSLSSVDCAVIDASTLFPQSLFGLAAPVLAAWLGILESANSYTLLQVIITCMVNRQHKYRCILITLSEYTLEGQVDSLLLN